MLQVQQLTKRYAGCTAVDEISFEVAKGEIVGFLGPNGAGKSTTMRILAGYLPASGGTAKVAGLDVMDDSIEVRRRVGYLPESCPLYPEMRVSEYLRYRARLKGVPGGQVGASVTRVLEQCGITDVRDRIIGQLSKGYRQRVGIADALVHNPELLILDEPTIGLDPNQIRLIRDMIRGLAGHHTVLLSTHILPEVESTCQRVIIINRGRIIASGPTDHLMKLEGAKPVVLAEVRVRADEALADLAGLPGVENMTALDQPDGWSRVELTCIQGGDPRELLAARATARRWPLRELHLRMPTLEEAFVRLTDTGAGGDKT